MRHIKNISLLIAIIFTLISTGYSQSIRLNSPSGGEYKTSEQVVISWETDKIGFVDILLFNGEKNEWLQIASSLHGASKKYEWNVPSNIVSGELYRFKIVMQGEPSLYAMSPAFITIIQTPQMGVSDWESIKYENVFSSPNPASNEILFSWSGKEASKIAVVEVSGKEVMKLEGEFVGSAKLITKELQAGIYFAIVSFSDGTFGKSKFTVVR